MTVRELMAASVSNVRSLLHIAVKAGVTESVMESIFSFRI